MVTKDLLVSTKMFLKLECSNSDFELDFQNFSSGTQTNDPSG